MYLRCSAKANLEWIIPDVHTSAFRCIERESVVLRQSATQPFCLDVKELFQSSSCTTRLLLILGLHLEIIKIFVSHVVFVIPPRS